MSAKTEQVGGSNTFREQSPGWRFLNVGEMIQKGDEVLLSNGWRKTICPGAFIHARLTRIYRRRIDGKKGKR